MDSRLINQTPTILEALVTDFPSAVDPKEALFQPFPPEIVFKGTFSI
jgi:hypothetical protein